MKRKLITFLFLSFFSLVAVSQDIHFSQFYLSPLNLNPAAAGNSKKNEVNFNYKNQWKSIASPYQTYSIAYQYRLPKKKNGKDFSAAGINVFNDKAGDASFNTLSATFNFARHVYLNNHTSLGAGVMGGFGQKTISSANFQTGSQYVNGAYNSGLPIGENQLKSSKTFADCAVGVYLNHDNSMLQNFSNSSDFKLNAGVSLFHLNRPDISFLNSSDKLSMKLVFYCTSEIAVKSTNFAIVPGILYQQQGPSKEILFGSLIKYKLKQESKFTSTRKASALSFGSFYRLKDALTVAVRFDYDKYTLGLSYDVNASMLTSTTKGRGGLEIAVRFVN